MREEKYVISVMHCAACSASVERVTRKLPGVARSEVNLTTGIMTIAYDESQCTQEQIVAKVEKAGFGAALHLEHPAPATVQNAEDAETAALKRRKIELIAAAVFSAVLLYVSMGQMLPFGLPALPLPDLFSMHTHPMNFAVLQMCIRDRCCTAAGTSSKGASSPSSTATPTWTPWWPSAPAAPLRTAW